MVKMIRMTAALLMFGLGCLHIGFIFAEFAEPSNGIASYLELEAVLVKQLESYLDKVENEQDMITR